MRKIKKKVCLLTFIISANIFGQDYKEDYKQIDALISKFYNAISFTKTKQSDDKTLSEIYHPDAKVGTVNRKNVLIFPEKEFRAKNKKAFKDNNITVFQEREIRNNTHIYGGVATRYSVYEFIIKIAEKERKVKGVNTFQLIKDPEKGWLIYSCLYSDNMSFPDPDN